MLRSAALLLIAALVTGCGASASTTATTTSSSEDVEAAALHENATVATATIEDRVTVGVGLRPQYLADAEGRVFVSRPEVDGVSFGLLGKAPIFRGHVRSWGVTGAGWTNPSAMLVLGDVLGDAIVKLDIDTGHATPVTRDALRTLDAASVAIDQEGATYFVAANGAGDLQRVATTGDVTTVAQGFFEGEAARNCEALQVYVDEKNVYGLESCGAQSLVLRADKATGARRVLAAEGGFVGGVAMANDEIVFATANGIRKVSKAGGAATTLTALGDGVTHRRLAVVNGEVWFNVDAPTPRIVRMPLAGGAPRHVVDLPADPWGQGVKIEAMFATRDAVYAVAADMDAGDRKRITLLKVAYF